MTESIKIIEHGYVFTCDGRDSSGPLTILTRGDRIAEVSPRGELFKSQHPSAEVIDATGKVLLPGFVDAHHHGESFVLRAFTQGYPYSQWTREPTLRPILDFVQSEAVPDDYSKLYRTSHFAGLKSGVTTTSEFGLRNPDISFAPAFEALGRTEVRGYIGLHNGDQVERARSTRSGQLRFALVLPPEDDLTTYNLQSMMRLAREFGWPLVVHYAETRRNFDVMKRNFGKSVVRMMQEYGVFECPLQLVHVACLDPGEIDVLAKSATPVILTPRSVMVKGTDIPPIEEILARRIPIAFGTDWGIPDPLDNIKHFLMMCRFLNLQPPSPSELLRMHTYYAAKALALHHDVGSLEAGKKADITFLESTDLRTQGMMSIRPPQDYLSLILTEMSAHNVSDVMINGEFFVRAHQILTYSEEDLVKETTDLIQRLTRLSPERLVNAPDERYAPSTVHRKSTEAPTGESTTRPEEGFKVVRKKISDHEVATKILPLEPPKGTQRVFGDDDI